MKKCLALLCVVAFMSGFMAQAQDVKAATTNDTKAATLDSKVYTCEKCHMDSKVAGKCPMCGEAMKAKHMIMGKDGKKFICECPADCTCTAMKEGDNAQCTCGKAAKEAKFMEQKK
jgi:hypothetical protein